MRKISKKAIMNFLERKNWAVTQANIRRARIRIRKRRERRRLKKSKELTIQESIAEWKIVYGRMRVSGTIVFAHSLNTRNLLLVIAIAAHEIDAIEKVWFDETEVTVTSGNWATGDYANKVYMQANLGSDSQSALSQLITDAPDKWTSNDRLRGIAHVYLRLKWDANLFERLPNITFTIRGKKVYDPRTATIAWSDNAALCIADYLTNVRFGRAVPLANINVANSEGGLYMAADVCDESVSLLGGGSESRYTCNAYFSTSEEPKSILDQMCSSMAGFISWLSNSWNFYPAKYRSPSITLNEADFRSGLVVKTLISKRDNFNAVRGTFVDATNLYEQSDFPAYTNQYYKEQDNDEQVFEDIELPCTTSASTCQRIAKIELERIRQGITVEAEFSLKAFQLVVGDTVSLSYSRFGWSSKIFEVVELEPTFTGDTSNAPSFGVRLVLRETASAVFDWDNGEETTVDLAPNTTLPKAGTVTIPTNLILESGTNQLYGRADGTVFSRLKVSWDALGDLFVSSGGQIEIQYKQSVSSDWQQATSVSGDSTFSFILDVKDSVSYDVRIRSVNAVGAKSDWLTESGHVVIGKTAPPSDVSGFSAQVGSFGIRLFWNAITDLDVSYYELRIGDTDDTWDDAVPLDETKATAYEVNLKTAATYRFMIKAVDTSKNKSTLAQYKDVTITAPTAVTSLTQSISGNNVVLSWTDSVTTLFALKEYIIKYGDTFGSSVELVRVKGTKYTLKVSWSGLRRFWIVPVDVADNNGTSNSVDVTILAPSVVTTLNSEVVDNNVLLRWGEPSTHTMPIDYYNIYKGNSFGSATLVGKVGGTFSALFEIVSGTYTYWVVAVDVAGNVGTEKAITAIVNEPPDFIISEDDLIDFSTGAYINMVTDNGKLYAPAYTSQSYESHFIDNGFTTWQDAIDAGNTYFLQPTPPHGYWEKTIDYGTTLPASLIKVLFTRTDISGSLSLTVKISYSLDDITYTEVVGSQAYASSFRYVKVRLEFGTLPGNTGEMIGLLGLTYP